MRLAAIVLLALFLASCSDNKNNSPQEPVTTVTWTKIGDYTWPPREDGVSKSSDGLVYMGFGKDENNQLLNDFWVIDPLKNVTEEVTGINTNKREIQLLDINGRLFLVADQQLSSFSMYEYDKVNDTWETRSNFTKEGIYYITAAFSSGGKGYYVPTEGANIWEYDPGTDEWTKKSQIPGTTSRDTEIFELNGKVYVYGLAGNLAGKMYVYQPSSDSWETVVTEDGPTVESGFASLSVSNLGYVVMGGTVTTNAMGDPISSTITGNVWEYNPEINKWTRKEDFPGVNRTRMFSFVLEGSGFVGSGFNSNRQFQKDIWSVNVIK